MSPFAFVILLFVIAMVAKLGSALVLPISRALSELISESARDKRARREGAPADMARLADVVESLEARLGSLEERLDFVEGLRAPEARRGLPAGGAPADEGASRPADAERPRVRG